MPGSPGIVESHMKTWTTVWIMIYWSCHCHSYSSSLTLGIHSVFQLLQLSDLSGLLQNIDERLERQRTSIEASVQRSAISTIQALNRGDRSSRGPVIGPLVEPVLEPVARFSSQHAILWGPGLWGPGDPGVPLLSTRRWTGGKIYWFRCLCGYGRGAGAYGEATGSTRVHSGRWWNIRIPNWNQRSREEVRCTCSECETPEASKTRLLWTCKERRRCLGSFRDVRRCNECAWWWPEGWESLPSMYC